MIVECSTDLSPSLVLPVVGGRASLGESVSRDERLIQRNGMD